MKDQMSDLPRLEEIRRRKRRQKIWTAVIFCLILIILLLWLSGIGELYVTRAGDLLETLELRIRPGDGFPVYLSMGTDTVSRAINSALVLLDEDEVCVYSDTGSLLRSFQHGYARPGIAAGKNRFCIYNRGGRELRMEGRSRTYGVLPMDKAIQLVVMSANGNFGVLTQSDSYQAQMTVYDDSMDELFTWYCANDHPVAAALSENGKTVAVACVNSKAGQLVTTVFTADADGERASLQRTGSLPLQMVYRPSGKLLVLYDDALVLYDANLDTSAEFVLSGVVQCCDMQSEDGPLISLKSGSGSLLILLDESLQPVRSVTTEEELRQCVRHGQIWAISRRMLYCFSSSAKEKSDTDTACMLTHAPICLINSSRLLLLTAKQILTVSSEELQKHIKQEEPLL